MTRKEDEKTELIYKEESYAIIGACMAAYKDKGCGFLEPVYHECLAIEFEFRGIPFLSKPPQTLQYRSSTELPQRNGLQVRIARKLWPLPKAAT